jgi:hypothetical protein
MDVNSCSNVPFDLLTDAVNSNGSISQIFKNIASDTDSMHLGCVLVSAVMIPPENSMLSVDITTENAAFYTSVNGDSLDRWLLFERMVSKPSNAILQVVFFEYRAFFVTGPFFEGHLLSYHYVDFRQLRHFAPSDDELISLQ